MKLSVTAILITAVAIIGAPWIAVDAATATYSSPVWHPSTPSILAYIRNDVTIQIHDLATAFPFNVLTAEEGCTISDLDWHPDGTHISYTYACGQLKQINMLEQQDGVRKSNQPLLVPGPTVTFQKGRFSTSGQFFAYVACLNPEQCTYQVLDTVDGGIRMKEIWVSEAAASLDWAMPDELVITAPNGDFTQIAVWDDNGIRFVTDFQQEVHPRNITHAQDDLFVFTSGDAVPSLLMLDIISKEQTALRNYVGTQPAWSPADDRLAFINVQGTNVGQVMVFDTNDSFSDPICVTDC